jgi:hypothetical protein
MNPASDALSDLAAGDQPPATAAGQAVFYDDIQPVLPVGEYQVIVQNGVSVAEPAPAANSPNQASYATVQRFRVDGPRVSLAPNDVVSMRPPPGSQGIYDTWLPHVLLSQRSLPWQVSINNQDAGAPTPWLAVLLFARGEIDVQGSPPAPGTTGVQTVNIAEYLRPPAGTLGPQPTTGLTNLASEAPQLTCKVVDVDFAAFRAVAPKTSELPFLASVRYVDASDQETLDAPYPGWYSLVIGNRLPTGAADNLYVAHLVSLEGFAGQLPDQLAATGYNLVRMVSLASWSFASTGAAGDFTALMTNLKVNPFTVPISPAGPDPTSQLIGHAVAEGYSMLGYSSRLGEQTIAWYRGPLQPAPVVANPQPGYPSAAAALVYDPTTGMFDVSYAAAWEIGRLLTLANGPVAASLATWVAAAAGANRSLMERSRTTETADFSPPERPGAGQTRRGVARQTIAEVVLPALLGKGGRRPAFGATPDPTRLSGRRMPGLLDSETLHGLLESSDDLYAEVRAHALRAAASSETAATQTEPPTAPEQT